MPDGWLREHLAYLIDVMLPILRWLNERWFFGVKKLSACLVPINVSLPYPPAFPRVGLSDSITPKTLSYGPVTWSLIITENSPIHLPHRLWEYCFQRLHRGSTPTASTCTNLQAPWWVARFFLGMVLFWRRWLINFSLKNWCEILSQFTSVNRHLTSPVLYTIVDSIGSPIFDKRQFFSGVTRSRKFY